MGYDFNLERFRWDPSTGQHAKVDLPWSVISGQLFVPPVPFDWLASLNQLEPKCWAVPYVALVIYALAVMTKRKTFPLTNKYLTPAGVGSAAKGRALAILEAAGFVSVQRSPNTSPTVTLIKDPRRRGGSSPRRI
jgi:hypothetical protein